MSSQGCGKQKRPCLPIWQTRSENYAVLSLANAKQFCQRDDKLVLLEYSTTLWNLLYMIFSVLSINFSIKRKQGKFHTYFFKLLDIVPNFEYNT